ncbi:MAG: thiamine-phosphate kinase, partial [Pseudomonadota bacterium]
MDEFDIIETMFAPIAGAPGAAGLRDDVAELDCGDGRLVATCDTIVEGVHFLSDDPIETVARKLVRVNVSDLLSKGARPKDALLSLAWPQGRSTEALQSFANALGDDLSHWGACLVGGDTVRMSGPLTLTLTLTGGCGERGPVRRSGASAGETVWVTGVIGAGALGLAAARRGETDWPASAYRLPELPRLAVADLIADYATASMDLSDGLVGDAGKLADASGVALCLDFDSVPWALRSNDLDVLRAQATG